MAAVSFSFSARMRKSRRRHKASRTGVPDRWGRGNRGTRRASRPYSRSGRCCCCCPGCTHSRWQQKKAATNRAGGFALSWTPGAGGTRLGGRARARGDACAVWVNEAPRHSTPSDPEKVSRSPRRCPTHRAHRPPQLHLPHVTSKDHRPELPEHAWEDRCTESLWDRWTEPSECRDGCVRPRRRGDESVVAAANRRRIPRRWMLMMHRLVRSPVFAVAPRMLRVPRGEANSVRVGVAMDASSTSSLLACARHIRSSRARVGWRLQSRAPVFGWKLRRVLGIGSAGEWK